MNYWIFGIEYTPKHCTENHIYPRRYFRSVLACRYMNFRFMLPLLVVLVAGCADPARRIRQLAADSGFLPLELQGGGFRLAAFSKPVAGTAGSLHVYLEGDGTPWTTRHAIAADPTPRNPVMLRLMALDPAPSLYLGRPCYLGHAADAGCSPELWTSHRYAPAIVDSMAAGLSRFLQHSRHSSLTFLGHSGGGALAVLLAARFPQTRTVATLAGNLDIAAWTGHHHYSQLVGSLDPAGVRLPGVREYHYFGSDDRTIPAELFAPLAQRRAGAKVEILRGFDHSCCWQDVWRNILTIFSMQ